ncbi:MAG TPA: dihydrolipoyl dehydrogenase [Pirellulaceae bacterium]|nr:dihydrolipoyl dehydrogenase [Pirellulaceae bacterium]HMO92522.1 dihydrolipoyl dehydrogenase [Pirellulaceae bacterium]HMP68995.1 dihydrolipoyl dehydrogenase [Pirellulaceae bacterium]
MHSRLVVIGGGPGGYAAAFLAADEGIEVTLVEAESRLGGTCLLRGCIPSKALLHVAKVMSEVDELGADWGINYGNPSISIDQLRARKDKVISTLSGGLGQLAKRRNVNIIKGHAKFLNSSTLDIQGENATQLSFDHCIIATGSVPAMPAAFDLGNDQVVDSTGALELKQIPETMLVIGGGYIGLEMGTVYAQLGSKVSVVELMEGLLMGADRDLVKPLAKRLKTLFEDRIYLNTKVGSIGMKGGKVEVAFEGPGKFGTELYDKVLVSVGRRPRTDHLGLENTKCQLDQRGFIKHDDQLRTDDPNIFVIGDAAGEPMLAHKATHEGRIAVETIAGKNVVFDKRAIPAVVFTDPEIAWAGITEEQAKAEGRQVEVAVYPWAASGRAQALGRTDGLTKWIIDPETDCVIGCGIVGPGAGELIAEAVLAIEMSCEVRDISESVHAHPTLSETLMNAAEVYFGTATEIYKPKKAVAH